MSLHILAQGTLRRDPVSRTSASGKTFATAQLRTEQDGQSIWCSMIVFDEVAQQELLRCKAGDAISAQGRLKLGTYEKGGEVRVSLDITANVITPLKPKPKPKQPRQARPDGRQFDAREAYARTGPAHEAEPDFDDPVLF